jgi:hypothetical protein
MTDDTRTSGKIHTGIKEVRESMVTMLVIPASELLAELRK